MQLTRRAALLLVLLLALAGCGSGDDEEGGGTSEPAATTTAAEECTTVEAPEPKPEGGETAPKDDLDPAKTYRLVFSTNCGSFTITLDQKLAPNTAASLVSLGRKGFYDGTTFHRVVPGFVIQGGDPTGTGAGGAGYKTGDVPPPNAQYVRGVVAMAKTAIEPPGTSGSQFFVVTGADAGLPAEYAIVGKVTAGLETTARIDALGSGDGPPTIPVVIEKVTVEVS